MGSKKRIPKATAAVRNLGRNSYHTNRLLGKSQIGGGASVADKLEALKNLIPSEKPEISSDHLFQETADYIVRLKTQVFVLQKLIDLYGFQQNSNAV